MHNPYFDKKIAEFGQPFRNLHFSDLRLFLIMTVRKRFAHLHVAKNAKLFLKCQKPFLIA
jgi:hypothetical protein